MNTLINDLDKVIQDKENTEVFEETLELEELRKQVVSRLEWIEKNDSGQFWWEDKPLIDLFITLYKCGCISLPKNPVERFRWIALLCLEISKMEEYACGNVVLPPDFLPEEFFEMYEDEYGVGVIDEIRKLRARLAERGWEAVFPE